MNDRWARVTEILDRALAEPPEWREAFIVAACAGDDALAAEVRSLLTHAAQSENFLEPGHTRLEPIGTGAGAPAPLGPGSLIGAWRLVSHIGEGGMGAVWLAERAEGQFTQRGALKLLRIGLAFEEAIRRFRRERQILASLDHPNIAHLLDGGSTPDGLPYLVMEYIEGRLLYAHCAAEQVPLGERLELFLDLCDAVHSAHQRLVVHRDLKPGNVMVTGEGTVKLLDFGVAKIFEAEAADAASALRTTDLPFTPLYASPEQLRGEEVGTASDVYSLGVLLYELLTGAHPYAVKSNAASEVIRAVLDTEPTRPSAAAWDPAPIKETAAGHLPPPPMAEPRALARKLSGDLDNIVLKAMAKDPARRYSSAERLAADVTRYLDGRPIEARPDSWSYRAAKFTRRNRVAVAAAAAGVLALLAGLGVSLRQTAVAREDRTLAERRLRDVQGLTNTLMFDVYDGIENMPGASAVRRNVIEKTSHYLDALAGQAGRDSSVRFSLADAYERLGTTQRNSPVEEGGGGDAALHSYARSRALREGLLRDYPDNEHALIGLVQVYTRIGSHFETVNRFSEALDMMLRAEQMQQRLVALHPNDASYAAGVPRRENNLGLALFLNHRVPEATVKMRGAAQGFASLAARDSSDWQSRRLLAMSLTVYDDCLLEQPGLSDSAAAVEHRALDIYRGLWLKRPQDLDLETRVADGYERLAQFEAIYGGAPDSAVAHIEIAQHMIEATAASDTADRELAVDALDGRVTRALVLALAGHTASADQAVTDVRPTYERWAARDTIDVHFREGLPTLSLASALIDLAHARSAPPADRESAWRTAKVSLDRAARLYGRNQSSEGPSPTSEGIDRWLDRSMAECDSALRATPAGSRASR